MFESLDDKGILISRVQNFFSRQKAVQQLNIPRPTAAIQAQPQVQAVKGVKAPAINFIDTRTRGNNNNNNVDTQIGIAVPSLDLHRLILASPTVDIAKRLELNNEIDRIIYSCTEAYQTEQEVINLAFGKRGYTTKVDISSKIKKLIKINPQLVKKAEKQAQTMDSLWENLEDKQTVEKKKSRARAYLRYGNVPLRLICNASGLVNYSGLPPHAMKINLNEQLEFEPDQMDAYVQHDAFNLSCVRGQWPESLMVWCGNFELEWLIYGLSPMLSGLAYYRALVRGGSILPDAREWCAPRMIEAYGDIANNPIDPQNLAETQYYTREEKKRRGESVHGFEHDIKNGFFKSAEMLSANTDYLSKLDDFKMYAANGSALFGMNLARRATPEDVTYATLRQIDEFVHENADGFLFDLSGKTDSKVFDRQIGEYNRNLQGERQIAGIENSDLIDPKLLELYITSSSPTTAERLTERATTAITAYEAGLYPPEMAAEVICQALDSDYEKCLMLLKKNPSIPNANAQAQKPNNAQDKAKRFVSQFDQANQTELDSYLQ